MKKITRRAFTVLLLALLIVAGLAGYVLRYSEHGRDWALSFSRANSGSTGAILDRNGLVLASFTPTRNGFADDARIRIANYHVTGDFWDRTGTGLLTSYWKDLQGFSPITGTTVAANTTLQLNVDAELDARAFAALDGQKGAVLMCNYRTGELLILVSSPAVDPADPNAVPEDGAYVNRALSAAFVPGSVFKLVTAAAAIENIPDIEDRSFYCEGAITIAGVDIICSDCHYTQTFEQALSNSCNVAFAKIAIMLGQDTLARYVRQFGFLDRQELDGIPTAAGNFPLEFVGDPELGWAGIGQSTDLVCPYALLRFVSAVANDGILCEPKLIDDGEETVLSRYMSAETAAQLQQMMRYNVVHHYEGDVNFPGLPLCAKTGTAELGDGTSHAWFTGFLLDDEHPYAFVVFVEQGGGGLTVAGAAANKILQFAIHW
ncbi:MAG: penicillin-binding protein [Oscillospiraceae bacterium]|nr:penicillin-binding protein [Oscillospiraceae bacterium]